MPPLYEFRCTRGHTCEDLVPIGRIRIRCLHPTDYPPWRCNAWASKILSPTPGVVKGPAVARRKK